MLKYEITNVYIFFFFLKIYNLISPPVIFCKRSIVKEKPAKAIHQKQTMPYFLFTFQDIDNPEKLNEHKYRLGGFPNGTPIFVSPCHSPNLLKYSLWVYWFDDIDSTDDFIQNVGCMRECKSFERIDDCRMISKMSRPGSKWTNEDYDASFLEYVKNKDAERLERISKETNN